MSSKVLVVDDEPSLTDLLSMLFESEGHQVAIASSVEAARQAIAAGDFDLVLSDILMPDGNGLDLLREIKTRSPQTAVIMMTAYSSHKSAIEAMKDGAFNYLSKPFDLEELKILARGALEKLHLESENLYLKRELEQKYGFANIIGRSSRMQEVFSLIERVARTTSTVLIRGESGTGKELVAKAIHYASPRRDRRFLSINCGALPENLLESELFGHEKGSFTGAVRDKKGLFQEADQGTLFLDEIGEMTAPMQVKLLRALQDRKIRKVGGNREEAIDVRIIAATNQELQTLIQSGQFREDLFYRINVIPIHLPPLRQRREDIPLLVDFFLRKYSDAMGVQSPPISIEAMKVLEAYEWPGNVRELENSIERALALATTERLTTRDLPPHLLEQESRLAEELVLPEGGLDIEAHLDAIRRRLMEQALERTGGVQTVAAELLKTSFRSFRYYAKKLGLTAGHPGEEE